MDARIEGMVRELREKVEKRRREVEEEDDSIEMSIEELRDQLKRAKKAVKFIYSKLPKLDKADSKRLARVKSDDWDQVE